MEPFLLVKHKLQLLPLIPIVLFRHALLPLPQLQPLAQMENPLRAQPQLQLLAVLARRLNPFFL